MTKCLINQLENSPQPLALLYDVLDVANTEQALGVENADR